MKYYKEHGGTAYEIPREHLVEWNAVGELKKSVESAGHRGPGAEVTESPH